jgi:hypothetical protein
MRTTLQRCVLLIILLAGSVLGAAAPAQAASGQIDGTAYFQDSSGGPCSDPPAPYAGFTSYAPLVMEGSLEGCWYTLVEDSRTTPSGVYLESGQELFVGSLDGVPLSGTFTTTYRFEAKYAPDGVTELHGRCQHPLVAGSGTGGFAGATGRVDFKDIIGNPVTYVYRGHIRLR